MTTRTIRLSPELARALRVAAAIAGLSQQGYITAAIEDAIRRDQATISKF